jgi:pantothenate kinase type III
VRLIADCGNSAVKLALAHDGGIWTHERLRPEEAALTAFIGPHRSALDELVLLPGSRAHADLLRSWWVKTVPGKPLQAVGAELPLPDLGQYEGCGADRVLAGLVATRQEGKPVIVVDAGTATTVTGWHFEPQAEPERRVRFLGGVIAPGARACIAGLSAAAPALPVVEPASPGASARQHDTRGAIAAAVGIGYGAMIGACIERLKNETGIATVVVTGGNASQLIEANVVPRLAYRPTLVLEGIEELARGR